MRLQQQIIAAVIAACGLTALGLGFYGMGTIQQTHETYIRETRALMLEQYDRSSKMEVETAASLVAAVERRQEQGTMTEAAARKLAADLVRELRYDRGENYFWIDGLDGVNVVLLGREIEGHSRYELRDSHGTRFIEQIITNGQKEGGGFTNYWFPKPGQQTESPKRSYSLLFAPYQWVIGTGTWIDELEAVAARQEQAYRQQMRKDLAVSAAIIMLGVLLTGLSAWLIGRRIAGPIQEMALRMREMADGNLRVQPIVARGATETVLLAESFNTMAINLRRQRNALEKSEARLRTLIQEAVDGIVYVGRDERIILVNRQIEQMSGYQQEELLTFGLDRLFSERTLQEKPLRFDLLAKGEIITEERELRGKAERPISVEMRACQLPDGTIQCFFRDISQHKEAQERLQAQHSELRALYQQMAATDELLHQQYRQLLQSEERYRLAMDGANDILWDWDIQADRVVWSDKAWELAPLPAASTKRQDWENLIHPADLSGVKERLKEYLSSRRSYYTDEFRVRGHGAEYRWILCRGKALFDEAGRPVRMAGSYTDISEDKKRDLRIEQLAYVDMLTGLPNRVAFLKELAKAIAAGAEGALLYIDLDDFKDINDTFGHAFGDKVLLQVAERLYGAAQAQAVVARLGGDEFTVLFSGQQQSDLEEYLRELQREFHADFQVDGVRCHVGFSIGIARWPQDGAAAEELLKKADMALFQAKAAGRNTHRFFAQEMAESVEERTRLGGQLRAALSRQELFLEYQPLVAADGRGPLRLEALLRWQHPELGRVSPAQFIPLAEAMGLIIPIGRWVMQQAAEFCAELIADGWQEAVVAVNVSVRQLMEDDFIALVRGVLDKSGLPPRHLELEITESVVMNDLEQAMEKLAALRALGIRVALDDFGTGYSSLTYLQQLPLDVIKVDQAFVRVIDGKKNRGDIVETVVALAHTLDMQVVAEGVETEDQALILSQSGCDVLQGYLISRPLSPDAAKAWLRGKNAIRR